MWPDCDFASTGDGQLTAIQLLSVMKRSGKKLSELAELMERYPQVMINVKISPRWKEAWKNIPEIEEIIENKEKELGHMNSNSLRTGSSNLQTVARNLSGRDEQSIARPLRMMRTTVASTSSLRH